MDFPKHYSLVKEHDKHFEIHDSRDGNTFAVAKNQVHPANQIKIMKLQKFASGGESVLDDPEVAPQLQASIAPQFDSSSQDPIPQTANSSVPEIGAAQPAAPSQPAPVQSQAQIPQAKPGVTPDVMNQFLENQGLEERGLQTKGSALAQEGSENAKAYSDANEKIGKFLEASNKSIDALGAQNETLSQEVAKSNIDPKAYFHNMTTGQKVGNAIALIIGGIGAGLSHGPNLALQTLNQAVERDIESQKANLGKKQSLLSLNLNRYKDMRAAQTATVMQMNAMLQGQLAANSAKYGGIAGQAGTQALLGQMKNQNLESAMNLKNQVFQLGLQQHLAEGDVKNDNPLDYVKWVVPADKQKDVAAEVGKAAYAAQNHDKLMDLWDRAQKEQTMMKTGFGLFDAPATRELRLLGDPLIHEADGRVNEFEKKDFEGTMPSSGQSDARQKELRNGFEQFIMGKQNAPLAKTYGIDVGKFNSTKMTPKGQGIERVFTQGPNKGKIGVFDENSKQFLRLKE